MNEEQIKRHMDLTMIRMPKYVELFGDKPSSGFPYLQLCDPETAEIAIDIFVFDVADENGDLVHIMVTNGMSDESLSDNRMPGVGLRTELVQYFRSYHDGHVQRLRDMAWLPHFDKFMLVHGDTIEWPYAATEGTPWKCALFLSPVVRNHSEFECSIEGESMSLLWHVPISEEELAYKKAHDVNAILDRMDETKFDWALDETKRTSLVPAKKSGGVFNKLRGLK